MWSRKVAFLWVIAGGVIIGGTVVAAALFQSLRHPHTSLGKLAQRLTQSITGVSQPVNILLIANNARDAKGPLSLGTAAGQADIMLLAHIDPAKHDVTFISIPRDTLIAMPDWNVPIPKIKTVFPLGLQLSPQQGPLMEMKAVSQLTGLPIHQYIVTDFQGFADAIDAVGGIWIDVKARLYDPYYSGVNLSPGWQTLNGQQALAFIRVRQNQAGNDYRVDDFQRQRAEIQVLEILKHKLLDSATDPARLNSLTNVWRKDVATNISTPRLLGLATAIAGGRVQNVILGSVRDSMDLASAPLPGVNRENYLTGAYYDVLDPRHIATVLKPYGSTGSSTGLPPIPLPSQVPVTVYGSRNVAQSLTKEGFTVQYKGSAGYVSRLSVYYPPGQMPWGWTVGRALGEANEWVAPGAAGSSAVIVYAP